jgi:hypothetical protein
VNHGDPPSPRLRGARHGGTEIGNGGQRIRLRRRGGAFGPRSLIEVEEACLGLAPRRSGEARSCSTTPEPQTISVDQRFKFAGRMPALRRRRRPVAPSFAEASVGRHAAGYTEADWWPQKAHEAQEPNFLSILSLLWLFQLEFESAGRCQSSSRRPRRTTEEEEVNHRGTARRSRN